MKHILSIIAAIVKAWLHSKSKAGKEERLENELEEIKNKMERLGDNAIGTGIWHKLYARRMSVCRKLHRLRRKQ